MTETTTEQFDCTTCGACCASNDVANVEVRVGDKTPRELTVLRRGKWQTDVTGQLQEGLCLMRRVEGRCVALVGTIGQRVACIVYDRRPRVCVQFKAGTAACLKARAQHGVGVDQPKASKRKRKKHKRRG